MRIGKMAKMILKKSSWKAFFDEMNRDHFGWQTSISVSEEINNDFTPNDTPSLAGMVFMNRYGQSLIELIVGDSLENHRTYTIFDPQTIELDKIGRKILIEIKGADAARVLITLIQPEKYFA